MSVTIKPIERAFDLTEEISMEYLNYYVFCVNGKYYLRLMRRNIHVKERSGSK